MNKRLSLIVFITGLIILIGSATFFCLDFFGKPSTRDAEYLVSVGTWAQQSEDNPTSVIWQFTEIGKGTLTTNNHLNDYDFLWAIDGDTLKIETAWLYDLEDEYIYKLDQSANTLTLTAADQATVFTPYTE